MLGISHNMDEELIETIGMSLTNLYKTLTQIAEPIIFESIFQANVACIQVYDWTKRRRKEIHVIDYPLSKIETGIAIAYSHIRQYLKYFTYNAVELPYYPWISVSIYDRASCEIPTVVNTYSRPEESSFADAFSHVYRSIESPTTANQTLITMAVSSECRIIALWNPDRPDFVPTMDKSSIDFILVEYGHPKMKGLMQLQLPDSIYMVGNEILSKAFVLRYLNHSCMPNTWYFDEDYIVRIIDHNADSLEIGSGQYIVLEKDGYRVVEDEYADMPHLIPVDSIEQFMCESDSENESPVECVFDDPTSAKRTYSTEDAVFVLDDFVDDGYSGKIDSNYLKPKQD
jgi:hypothetical protein